MKFVCLGYYDEEQWNRMTSDEQNGFMDHCFEYDAQLQQAGHVVGGEGLDDAAKTTTVRRKDGKITVTDGPYAETREQIGGFFVLEAADMAEATRLISDHPGLKAGPFEIRPVVDMTEMIRESEKRRAAVR